MFSTWTLLSVTALSFAATNLAAPSNPDDTGFLEPRISYSAGGHAICVEGLVPVHVSTNSNARIQLPDTIGQIEATQLLLDLNSVNSSTAAKLTVSPKTVNQTYHISSRLCYPRTLTNFKNIRTLQFLTHGVAFSKSYWDFAAPSNSYIDAAAQAGSVTFSYDRLGVGDSAHPDPIQIVQGPVEIALAHSLITLLRNGALARTSFTKVIGVGHSYGSALTTSIAGIYPFDLNAVIVTGFSVSNITGATQFASSLNLISASSAAPKRFSNLPDGYLLPSTLYGVQYSFFSFPDFTSELLLQSFATIETTTWGEQITMDTVGKPASSFTGPVYVVNGEFDLFFCDGNCHFPSDISAQTLKMAFPNAKAALSGSLILPGSGHGVNLASNAEIAFQKIQKFVAQAII